MPLQDPLKRDFYAHMCQLENWSVRQLRERINSMLYERTAIAKKSEELIKNDLKQLQDEDKLSPDLVFSPPKAHQH
jgi:predicted nuclease of restriction endonuclease-like (RecB) superfamily